MILKWLPFTVLLGAACTPAPSRTASEGATAGEVVAAPTQRHAAGPDASPAAVWPARTRYLSVEVGEQTVFYREAGDPQLPTLLLLHGYPSSSHTYRHLIPLLSGRFHVVAPDNLGSGYSSRPSPDEEPYTFDGLAEVTAGFVDAVGLDSYVLYMQDFGAPVGFRLAMARPERVRGLIAQNANAYLDGLTPPRQEFFRSASEDRSDEKVQALAKWVSDDAIRETQYLRDVPGERAQFMPPDAWTHDIAMLQSESDRRIQVQLFQDYQSNIDAYPRWQEWMRAQTVPALVLWGERDPAFVVAGARAYLRDLPHATLRLLDAGHFAAEERPVEVAKAIVEVFGR
mgnify:CR=1 FL=1